MTVAACIEHAIAPSFAATGRAHGTPASETRRSTSASQPASSIERPRSRRTTNWPQSQSMRHERARSSHPPPQRLQLAVGESVPAHQLVHDFRFQPAHRRRTIAMPTSYVAVSVRPCGLYDVLRSKRCSGRPSAGSSAVWVIPADCEGLRQVGPSELADLGRAGRSRLSDAGVWLGGRCRSGHRARTRSAPTRDRGHQGPYVPQYVTWSPKPGGAGAA